MSNSPRHLRRGQAKVERRLLRQWERAKERAKLSDGDSLIAAMQASPKIGGHVPLATETSSTENGRLRAAFDAFSKAASLPGGPSLAMQQHDPTWLAWKNLCDAFAAERR